MKVLVACECSGRVRDAFRKLGHDAWSCDLQLDERQKHQSTNAKFHLQGDIHDFISLYPWDLMIAHPPCTDIAVSGSSEFKYKIKDGRQAASIKFFLSLVRAPIPRIAIENPVCIMSTEWQQPTQIIQPWMFGDSETKTTCLWLKNLPNLKPTCIVDKGEFFTFKSGKRMSMNHYKSYGQGKERSRTYHGIARAMASQWGNPNNLNLNLNKHYYEKRK